MSIVSYETIKSFSCSNKKIQESMIVYYPTNYRISTITSTAYLGTTINLNKLFLNLDIELYNINYIEYNNKDHKINIKGYNKKYEKKKRRGLLKRCFDNQVTIVFSLKNDNFNVLEEQKSIMPTVNMKIFKNGKIQITGVRSIENGELYINKIIDIIKDIYKYDNEIIENIDIINEYDYDYKIRLINSDFKMGFPIKRDRLYKLLLTNYNNLICSYEPCIYPGVKISYFYNESKNIKDGICMCNNKSCFTKKNGNGIEENSCKKITIVVFQSGSVIITGSNNKKQLDECYNFIINILNDNVEEIELINNRFISF